MLVLDPLHGFIHPGEPNNVNSASDGFSLSGVPTTTGDRTIGLDSLSRVDLL